MFFRKLVVGLVAACACVSTVTATPTSVKVKNFQSIGPGMIDNPRADGMAMLKAQGTGARLHLHMDDLQRNTWYGVALATYADPGTLVFNDNHAFKSNSGGDGSFDVSLSASQNPGLDPIVYIYIWDGVGNDLSVEELRAYGSIDPSITPTVKIKDFDSTGAGDALNPEVDGMAVVKFNPFTGGSDVHIHMRDLSPNTIYGVGIVATNSGDLDFSDPGIDPISMISTDLGGLQTNCEGRGTYEVSLTSDMGSSPTIYLYVWNGTSDYGTLGVDGITTGELRVIGTVDSHPNCHP